MQREKSDILKSKLSNAPKQPGCYLWKNNNNEVIYVGKAKNIKNRINQYFNNPQNLKNSKLVNEIYDVDFIITNSENEALILENNLVKKYWPKYNILLKDNCEYPYILVTDEEHPRLIYTHNTNNKIKGKYYGPLADYNFKKFKIYKTLLGIIPFRTCNKIPNKKCIRYDMGLCFAPCIKNVKTQDYNVWKKYVDDFFKNKNKELLSLIKSKELNSAQMLNFEMAQNYKETYDAIKSLEVKQIMQITNLDESDYIAYYRHDNYLSIIIFKYIDAKLLSKHNDIIEINSSLDETISEFINNYYSSNSLPAKVYVNLNIDELDFLNQKFDNKFKQPKQKELSIIELALKNAKDYYEQNLLFKKQKFHVIHDNIEQLSKLTGINNLKRIEIFDNSNINFTNNVSSMAVFINGVYDKKLSRNYKLDSNINSDYELMKNVIHKRFNKFNNDLPNLIIVDGSIIQINACLETLKQLNLNIPTIGLAKDNKHQTDSIILTNKEVYKLKRNSELYKFLWQMQETVHNSAINYFRNLKIKNDLTSLLDSIPGLGKKRLKKLSSFYKTIEDLKRASIKELQQIIPEKVAILLLNKLKD